MTRALEWALQAISAINGRRRAPLQKSHLIHFNGTQW